MVAFCLSTARLTVQNAGAVLACQGHLCDGLYGHGSCACVKVVHLPRHVLSLTIAIDELADDVMAKMQPFQSRQLTETLVDLNVFEVLYTTYFFN
jgi:hypothetical protein